LSVNPNLPPGLKGATTSTGDEIMLNPWQTPTTEEGYTQHMIGNPVGVRSLNNMISTLLHEGQHGVQTYEGMARGSSTPMAQADLYGMAQDPNLNLSPQERDQFMRMSQEYPRQAYLNAAGEVEARNVQTRRGRQDSGMANKRQSLTSQGFSPASTEDVPRRSQFLFPSLTPVEHDPMSYASPTNPIPVEYNPFEGEI